jgi:hypothetical protein
MIKRVTATLLVLLILISMIGCAGSPVRRSREAARNRSNLVNLKIGMAKNQVVELMGAPSKTEAYEIQGKTLEFWLYLTEYTWTEFTGAKADYTPLAFEGDIVKGWGRNYYDQALRIKQEIRIEQK